MSGVAGHNPNKLNLSKGLLSMKFMSRSVPMDEKADTYGKRDTQWVSDEGNNSSKHIKYEGKYYSTLRNFRPPYLTRAQVYN